MTLSILCQTYGALYAEGFLSRFRLLANVLKADLVIAGDGDAGEAIARRFADTAVRIDMQHTPEEGIRPGAQACRGDWILRFDDDETCSPAMLEWLLKRVWEQGTEKVFSFPYAWLWGDDWHFITSAPFWPDPHARLMPREMTVQWHVAPHAGNRFGLGMLVPVAHCHHKFLVQSREHREMHAKKLDAVGAGLGLGEHYGKFMFPERFCKTLTVREVGHGDVKLDEWVGTGDCLDQLAAR